MRSDGHRLVPAIPRSFARAAVVLATIIAILAFAWFMPPASDGSGAVVRVSLSDVPEERVVHFGHELADRDTTGTEVALADAATDVTDEYSQSSNGNAAEPATPSSVKAQPQGEQRLARFARPDANGVLPIGFSLTEGVSSVNGGVGVPKTLASEAGDATGLTIFLIGGSLIEIDRGELVNALARLGASDKAGNLPAAGESGRLSLDRVRTAGLDLRYDAIRDRLVLRP